MIYLRDAYAAVCRIGDYTDSKFTFIGHGVLVAPDRILTNLHVLQGAANPAFVDCDGRLAQRRIGGRHAHNESWDLATVELDQRIGSRVCQLPMESPHIPVEKKGYLVTRFNNVAAAHKVSILEEIDNKYEADGIGHHFSIFSTDGDVRPGYSGSPVIDSEGRVLSVVTSLFDHPEDFWSICRGKNIKPPYQNHFMGARPADLLAFSNQHLRR